MPDQIPLQDFSTDSWDLPELWDHQDNGHGLCDACWDDWPCRHSGSVWLTFRALAAIAEGDEDKAANLLAAFTDVALDQIADLYDRAAALADDVRGRRHA